MFTRNLLDSQLGSNMAIVQKKQISVQVWLQELFVSAERLLFVQTTLRCLAV